MTPPIAAAGELSMSSEVLLAQVLERMGEVLETMGSMKSRLDHGQKQFDTLHREQEAVRKMLAPVAAKVGAWAPHIEAAKQTTEKFKAMEPEFGKMKKVTGAFLSVAMVQGTVVGAALWGLTLIWPVVWEFIKTHISVKLGG